MYIYLMCIFERKTIRTNFKVHIYNLQTISNAIFAIIVDIYIMELKSYRFIFYKNSFIFIFTKYTLL